MDTHAERKAPNYLLVFAILALFTAMEVGISQIPHLPHGIKIAVLVFLAATKVGLVLLYFMHVKFDTRAFVLPFALGAVIAVPLILTLTLSPPEIGKNPNEDESGGNTSSAAGAQLVQEKCTLCHTLDRVNNAHYDLEGWEKTVDRMVGYGCQLNNNERDAVVNYLVANNGPSGAAATQSAAAAATQEIAATQQVAATQEATAVGQ